jgi:hypothetical protein
MAGETTPRTMMTGTTIAEIEMAENIRARIDFIPLSLAQRKLRI